MITRLRFSSDTNRSLFIQGIEDKGVKWRGVLDDVWVEEWPLWMGTLAANLNADVVFQEGDFTTTSGLEDAGFHEAPRAATAPDHEPPARMKRWPQRRSTRSQPI